MEEYKDFWMIYVEGASSPNKRHYSYDSVYKEAERLAKLHIGKRVYILRPTAAIVQELAPITVIKL
jgi:hypothetical protein